MYISAKNVPRSVANYDFQVQAYDAQPGDSAALLVSIGALPSGLSIPITGSSAVTSYIDISSPPFFFPAPNSVDLNGYVEISLGNLYGLPAGSVFYAQWLFASPLGVIRTSDAIAVEIQP